MTDTPPLYARYLAADRASGFPGAWQTSTAPFDGAQLYELSPLRGLSETENEMEENIRKEIDDCADAWINEPTENLLDEVSREGLVDMLEESEGLREAMGERIASLTAANSAQAQRIKEIKRLLISTADFSMLDGSPCWRGWTEGHSGVCKNIRNVTGPEATK